MASDSDFTASSDCESEFGYYSAANKRKTRPGLTRQNLMSEERLQRVAEFAAQLSPPRSAGISSFVGQYFFFQIDFLMTMIFYFLIYKLLNWKLVLMNSGKLPFYKILLTNNLIGRIS